jgi:hypothetical protein
MPQIFPQDMAQIVCSGPTGSGDVWNNVFAVRAILLDDIELNKIAGRFTTFYGALVAANVYPQDWRCNNMSASRTQAAGNQRRDVAMNVGQPSGTNQPFPSQIAIVLSHQTAFSGKSFRGRTYLGPNALAARAPDGTIAGSVRDAIKNAADALRTGLATDQHELLVWSRKLASTTPVVAAKVGPYFDTMRSRRSALRG